MSTEDLMRGYIWLGILNNDMSILPGVTEDLMRI